MAIGGFFTKNLDLVHFFYGPALVILGISIFAQLRATRESLYKLVNILWLLAVFGLIHHSKPAAFTGPQVDFGGKPAVSVNAVTCGSAST